MQEHLWDVVERLYDSETSQESMTQFEKEFVSGLIRRGMNARVSSKQEDLLLRIEKERLPRDPAKVRLDYNMAVRDLLAARNPDDLLALAHAAIDMRCRLLKLLPDENARVCSHNLAESLVATLRKDLPTC